MKLLNFRVGKKTRFPIKRRVTHPDLSPPYSPKQKKTVRKFFWFLVLVLRKCGVSHRNPLALAFPVKQERQKSCVQFPLFLDSHLSPPLSVEKKSDARTVTCHKKLEKKEKRKNPNCRFRRLARSFVSFRNSFFFREKTRR